MDEFFFRISHQLELLQLQILMTSQQGQNLFLDSLSQIQYYFQEICKKLPTHQLKEISETIFFWLQTKIRISYQFVSSIPFNFQFIHENLKYFQTLEATRRDIIIFVIGLSTGTIIGYTFFTKYNTSKNFHFMKSIICHDYFGPEAVTLVEDEEIPIINYADELLIQVKAASLQDIDIKISHGYAKFYRRLLNYGKQASSPVTLGRACSGIVIDIGKKVINFDIGDRVFLAVPSWAPGTMSEFITVPEERVAKMPKILSFEACASIPYDGCIALSAFKKFMKMKQNSSGKRVLIYDGSSSIGCILIQLIKIWGGYIVSTCKKQAVPVLEALGADEVISTDDSDFLKELDLREKFDAVFYTGNSNENQISLYKSLFHYGIYISTTPEYLSSDYFGYLTGSLFFSYVKIRLLFQFMLGISINHWKDGCKIKNTYLQYLKELVESNQLQPVLGRIYTVDCIEQALSHVVNINAIGSTVIRF